MAVNRIERDISTRCNEVDYFRADFNVCSSIPRRLSISSTFISFHSLIILPRAYRLIQANYFFFAAVRLSLVLVKKCQ